MKSRLIALSLSLLPLLSIAAEDIAITIKDHKFTPAEIRVPAGQKVKLVIENQDATPEEFESATLNREKIIAPKSKATVWIGPLKPGKYPFMGEFNQATAKGVVIAE